MTFFLLLILENHVKKVGTSEAVLLNEKIKSTMERCCHHGAQQPPYLANKTAQVMSLAFAKLYPAEWSDFFPNLITNVFNSKYQMNSRKGERPKIYPEATPLPTEVPVGESKL